MKKINIHLIICLISLIILIISILGMLKTITVIHNLIYIEATITEVETNTNTATIEYQIDDKTYTNQIIIDEELGINDTIEIINNKNNPGVIIKKPSLILYEVLIPLSSILVIYFAYLYVSNISKKSKIIDYKQNGIYIEADITEVIINNQSKPIKEKYPYIIKCSYTNPTDQHKFDFQTKDLYFNVTEIIENNNIKKIPIYVDKNDYSKYYIDTDYILNKQK